MAKDDRSLIGVGIFGLSTIMFGFGISLGGDWTGQPPMHPLPAQAPKAPYESLASARDFAAYPNGLSSNCYASPNHDAADLCAQWRAAIAAESAARSAVWNNRLNIAAAILSAIGLFLLLRSLKQTEIALAAARESNAIALHNSFLELRPWLAIEVELTRFEMTEQRIFIGVLVSFSNTGKTIATNIDYKVKCFYSSFGKAVDKVNQFNDNALTSRKRNVLKLPPNASSESPIESYQSTSHVEWINDKVLFVIACSVRYTSEINGQEHVLEQSFTLGDLTGGMIEQRMLKKTLVGRQKSDMIIKGYLTGRAT